MFRITSQGTKNNIKTTQKKRPLPHMGQSVSPWSLPSLWPPGGREPAPLGSRCPPPHIYLYIYIFITRAHTLRSMQTPGGPELRPQIKPTATGAGKKAKPNKRGRREETQTAPPGQPMGPASLRGGGEKGGSARPLAARGGGTGQLSLTSCSSAGWPASPGLRRARRRWWHRWPGCTSCGDGGSAGPACP